MQSGKAGSRVAAGNDSVSSRVKEATAAGLGLQGARPPACLLARPHSRLHSPERYIPLPGGKGSSQVDHHSVQRHPLALAAQGGR